MAILVSDARTAFIRLKKDITDVSTATFAEWCDFVNKFAYRKLLGVDPERFISETNYTVSTEPQTSALPSDFMHIQSHGMGFYEIDSDSDDTENRLIRTQHGSRQAGYYISGTNVVFTGIDDSTIYTLRYAPTPTTIDALTDYFTLDATVTGEEIIDDQFLNYVIKALDVLYTQWDEEVGAESFADARFIRVMSEFLEDMRKEPAAYALPDFSINF